MDYVFIYGHVLIHLNFLLFFSTIFWNLFPDLTSLFIIFIISFPTDVYKSVKIQSVYIDEYIRCLT